MSQTHYLPPKKATTKDCDCEDDDNLEWIAGVAVALDILSFLPQIWNVYAQHSAKNLSYIWLITSLGTNFIWLYFGLAKQLKPLIVSSSFFAIAFFVLGIMKILYDR